MQTSIKSILQKTNLTALLSIGFAAGATSTQITTLHPILQTTITATSISIIAFLVYNTTSTTKYNKHVIILFLVSTVLTTSLTGFLATTFFVSLFVVFSLPFNSFNRFYVLAGLMHFADVISTVLVLPQGYEQNMVARIFIQNLGVLPGLTLLKTLFVGFPLLYSYNYLDDSSQQVFVKTVLVLGAALAFRNFSILV